MPDTWGGADKVAHFTVGSGIELLSVCSFYAWHKKDLEKSLDIKCLPTGLDSTIKECNAITREEEKELKLRSIIESTAIVFVAALIKEGIDKSRGEEFSWKDITYTVGGSLIVSIPFYFSPDKASGDAKSSVAIDYKSLHRTSQ